MGASIALAGVSACTRQPVEKIVPYVRQPEEIIPGRPLFYATSMPEGGFAHPVLAENHMGRPTKLEGNPEHPASLGATDLFSQASVLNLYDPDRSRTIVGRGEVRTWGSFVAALTGAVNSQRAINGQGLRILTEPITSPSLAEQMQALIAALPQAKWHQWDAVYGVTQGGAPQASAIYRFAKAEVVVSLDSDFLGFGPGAVRYTKDFSSRRRMGTPQDQLNRMYVVEPVPTVTGANADHRLAMKASEVAGFAAALAAAVGARSGGTGTVSGDAQKWVSAIAADLAAHKGTSVVVAGDRQPAVVHALARAMNEALGNAGVTVTYTAPIAASPADGAASIAELVAEMKAGKVDLLVIFGGNPAFTAPADLGFAEALGKVTTAVHFGQYFDETAERCHWHVNEAHYLESWGDARAFDGTASVIQPLVAPIYEGHAAIEILAVMNGAPGQSAMELVKTYWSSQPAAKAGPDAFWRRTLHDGFVAGTSALQGGAMAPAPAPSAGTAVAATPASGIEILFRPDPNILDGRYANNGWLQELPKPLSKVTWDNVAYLSVTTAARLGVANEDVIEVTLGAAKATMPVWILPGTADDVVVVHFGYGRRRTGRVGTGLGTDTFRLRTSSAPWFASGGQVTRTGNKHPLASTQNHFAMEHRHPVRVVNAAEYRSNPKSVLDQGHNRPPDKLTLYPIYEYTGHKWGMAIDLNACTGCGICVAACVAENNIPVVGKTQVKRSREMHWLRVDTYFEGDPAHPEATYHQPVPCQQCENAPCETVCPVAATTHSDEGLNDMVYNRCVGTRYCSNNCPYKVRRFNFMLYADFTTPELYSQRNPDVTIRSRGVMEKCTYCVQRINQARVDAKTSGEALKDGDIKTACQQVCPADAIVFGDLNDKNSQVVKLKQQDRNYGMLEDLGTRPRTSYLAVVRNPNEALKS
jgi:molybdopterin-containing oxidoreductase family iron-sulfur binding subunit